MITVIDIVSGSAGIRLRVPIYDAHGIIFIIYSGFFCQKFGVIPNPLPELPQLHRNPKPFISL